MFAQLPDTGSCYTVLLFVFVAHTTLKAEAAYHCHRLGHRTTVLHDVASHCSHIFNQIFLRVTTCLHISMNYTENVAELLTHVQTVDIPGAPL